MEGWVWVVAAISFAMIGIRILIIRSTSEGKQELAERRRDALTLRNVRKSLVVTGAILSLVMTLTVLAVALDGNLTTWPVVVALAWVDFIFIRALVRRKRGVQA